ncbi:hypothetical protein VPH35_047119 [Triticum aestivum]
MATAAARDRFSELPDDLLIHILSFAPVREAASTTALSRRWRRPLWLDTGAVNVDYRSYTTGGGGGGSDPLWTRVLDDITNARLGLIRSSGRGPNKFTLVMRDDSMRTRDYGTLHAASSPEEDEEEDSSSIDDEEDSSGIEDEADPVGTAEEESAAGVVVPEEYVADAEEFRLEWLDYGRCTLPYSLRSVPFAALRVLELTGYALEPFSDRRQPLAFPCLEAMRLRRCRTKLATLQDIISAAPKLADIHLESVRFVDTLPNYSYRVRCPAATVLLMANCGLENLYFAGVCSIEVDAPRLRRLGCSVVTFQGTSFSFESPMTHLEEVHLALHSPAAIVRNRCMLNVDSMRHVRVLKLTAYSMGDLADTMSFYFPNLDLLEVEELCGWCVQNHGAVARAVVSLLSCCPAVREVRLKFRWLEYLEEISEPDQIAAMSDLDDGDEDCCDDSDLQGLCRRCRLPCLQNSLRRVVIKFDTEKLTCLQVRLVKFLAKNAMVLEEFVIDGQKGYDSSRIHRKVARWQKQRPSLYPLPPRKTPIPRLSEFPPLDRQCP